MPHRGEPNPAKVRLDETFQGRWHLDGDLNAEDGALLHKAVEDLADELFRGEQRSPEGVTRTLAERQAAALMALVGLGTAVDPTSVTPARPSVILTVDLDDL